jgi:4'-phosphopantetheinyl transferase
LSKPPTSNAAALSTALWLVDCRRLHADDVCRLQARLSPGEARHFARFIRTERQRQYLLGRMLLRLAVGRLLNVPPESIDTIERIGLSPSLALPDGCPHPGFSLSHSGPWVACAISPSALLGLDIEIMDAARDLAGIAETAFQPVEAVWLDNLPDAERIAAFYRLWTLKEALFKLTSNRGHAQDDVSLVDGIGAPVSHGDGWFAHAMMHADIAIALCSTQPLPDITLVDASQLLQAA